MIRIPLHDHTGRVRAHALVDDQDAGLAELRWSRHSQGYAYRWRGSRPRVCVLLHRAVVGLEVGDPREVDHENRDRLDCRRGNLRVTTRAGNTQNIPARGRSRFRGVTWHKRMGKWTAKLQINRVQEWVGSFDEELAAAIAVNERRRQVMPWALPDPEVVKALEAAA